MTSQVADRPQHAQGHVFVIRGDLTKLACDAVLLPCDSQLNINTVWSPLLPEGLEPGSYRGWLRLPADLIDGVVGLGPAPSARANLRSDETDAADIHGGPEVYAVATTVRGSGDSPAEIAERLRSGVARITAELQAQGGRKLPLIAMPLVGSGDGGQGSSRSELIDAVLRALRTAVDGVDVALVLHYWSDIAAVQNARDDQADWQELSADLRAHADHLGLLASQDRLSLFIGAGVSVPVGLPDWWSLLEQLAARADMPFDKDSGQDHLSAATLIKEQLGSDYGPAMQELLHTSRHAIGHALLAGLRVRQMVTTNFDQCMEIALAPTVHEFRVLTQKLANSSVPWLLKLHGDLYRPESLVFTREDYARQSTQYRAVYGVVESLMLTSHLLFVGFGLTDKNFLELATAVREVRSQAEADPDDDRRTAGTALALTREAAEKHQDLADDLAFISMQDGTDTVAAARVLEMFLDRVSWAAARRHNLAAEYLLDDRYLSGLSREDRALRDRLAEFTRSASPVARASAGWPRVAALLRDLGYREDRRG